MAGLFDVSYMVIRLSFQTGCDEVKGSNHVLSKANLDPMLPEETNALFDSTAFAIFNNDTEELTNTSFAIEDNELSGHIIEVPATKTNQSASGICWPR